MMAAARDAGPDDIAPDRMPPSRWAPSVKGLTVLYDSL